MRTDRRSRTFEQVKELCRVAGYRSKGELGRLNPSLYEYARRHGFLPRLVLELGFSGNRKLDKNKCAEIALKYKSRSEFKREDQSAYVFSRKNKFLDELCAHTENLRGVERSYDFCKSVVKTYSDKTTFNEMEPAVSSKIYRAGWSKLLDDLPPRGDFSKKIVYEIRSGNTIYIGMTSDEERREREHAMSNMCRDLVAAGAKLRKLTKPLPIVDAAKAERFYIKKYRDMGLEVRNKAKGGAPGKGR